MLRLLTLVEKHLGREWVGATEWLRNLPANSVDEIERRLVAGDYAGLVKEVEQAALRFAAESQAMYQRSGQQASRWLDTQVSDKLIRFDTGNPRVVQRARENQLDRVREMTQDTRSTIRAVLADTTRNPRELAREIRESIGLTQTQSQHVANYRRALETGDYADALGRELRDARADRTLRAGKQLSPDQIDRMVDRYRQNYVAYRAETIARTEAARNVHEGIADSFQQAVDRGDIEADSLVKEWIPGPRTRHARDDHRSAALLEQRPGVREPFVMADGTRMMFPGQGPVEHVANCRCTVAHALR
jgi:hypothetical protein